MGSLLTGGMGVSPMFAVLRNLASTPDKKQERSDLQAHPEDQRQDAEEEEEFKEFSLLPPRLGVLAFSLLFSRKNRFALL